MLKLPPNFALPGGTLVALARKLFPQSTSLFGKAQFIRLSKRSLSTRGDLMFWRVSSRLLGRLQIPVVESLTISEQKIQTASLDNLSLDNISIPFRRLHRTIESITRSLPYSFTIKNKSSVNTRNKILIRSLCASDFGSLDLTAYTLKINPKDLTSSSLPPSEVDDQSEENSQRLKSTWSRVRNTLGAPLPDYQELTKADDRGPNGEDSDSVSEEDTNETENADIDLPEYNEADPNNETKQLETCPTDTNPISSGPREFELKQLYHQVLMSTTPSSRRLDLSSVEVEEVEKHGTLQSRKQKVQAARKGTSVRSLLAEEQGGAHVFAEGICWALEETCKSIHHRLHSRASAIVITTDSHRATARLATTKPDCGASETKKCFSGAGNIPSGFGNSGGCPKWFQIITILGSTLDLLCDEKSKDCHELSSTTAIFVLDHLSRFHSSLPDAPLEQPDSQKMSLKECYDWISISSLLPIDNIAVHHDEIDEWCQHLLMIPAPSGFDVSEGLRARYISDSESGTPINRTMLLSTMLNVARRLCSTGNSRSRTLLLDCLPFIVEIWGWDRGILNTVREICQDARDSRFTIRKPCNSSSDARDTNGYFAIRIALGSLIEAVLKNCRYFAAGRECSNTSDAHPQAFDFGSGKR
ncbi:hypothetical protein Pst134EA_011683 [Puccinia striiformis f. sp. tritici]|uniref:hypothetical protein n=1 Tax=Puccinia striiformis f. sp. tritici TaxID=168172 RepID=UPI002007795F|nr:hypothetical protein Pst134EA_011683 [Puccinia striiformis f. sp. tritici]KAH9456169.1 hypothetical protein Pst134EB_012372 [Puccinia striiformis f. sp. tritici]KAH9468062.1 hypothetical protein Pst134EA_011683 [Puccinia striiformis f. sp. tritici]